MLTGRRTFEGDDITDLSSPRSCGRTSIGRHCRKTRRPTSGVCSSAVSSAIRSAGFGASATRWMRMRFARAGCDRRAGRTCPKARGHRVGALDRGCGRRCRERRVGLLAHAGATARLVTPLGRAAEDLSLFVNLSRGWRATRVHHDRGAEQRPPDTAVDGSVRRQADSRTDGGAYPCSHPTVSGSPTPRSISPFKLKINSRSPAGTSITLAEGRHPPTARRGETTTRFGAVARGTDARVVSRGTPEPLTTLTRRGVRFRMSGRSFFQAGAAVVHRIVNAAPGSQFAGSRSRQARHRILTKSETMVTTWRPAT